MGNGLKDIAQAGAAGADTPHVTANTIDGKTRLMAMIGDPIAQVRTPQAINPVFAAMAANITCVPMCIATRDLEAAWAGLKAMRNLIGFSVTKPHKTEAAELCDSVDPTAALIGAVNVVRREADGTFRGYQFDGLGFVRGLTACGHDPRMRDCLLIGAGGAAAAIAFALIDSGARSVGIANRTAAKAQKLVSHLNRRIGKQAAHLREPQPRAGELVINATSLGMIKGDPLPVAPHLLDATMLVADAVANPEITEFLRQARIRGATVHSGIHMVDNQVELIARHLAQGVSA